MPCPFFKNQKLNTMSLTRIKTMYDIVKLLLQNNINMRDDDNLLVSKIWGFTLVDMDIKPSQNTMTLFLQMYRDGKLPNADIITRARRKVQEECVDLRGSKWEERHKEAKNVQDNIVS
jgi:hypothetical protein